jgi:hypothetical protein
MGNCGSEDDVVGESRKIQVSVTKTHTSLEDVLDQERRRNLFKNISNGREFQRSKMNKKGKNNTQVY